MPTAPLSEPPAAAPATVANSVLKRYAAMIIAVVTIWVVFAWWSPSFIQPRNLSSMAVELSITAVLAIGMLLVMLPGQIDLSVGSGLALFGAIAAVLIFNHNWPAPVAMGVGFVAALVMWIAMGALIVTERIPAFIVTLAGMLIFRGLQLKVTQISTIPIRVGDKDNLASSLTTSFLSPAVGLVLVAAIIACITFGALRSRRRRIAFGLPTDDAELTFMKLFITAQLLLLFVLVCNQFRGVPISAVILGVVALFAWVLTQHTRFGRYLYAIGGNEEAAVISGVPVKKVIIAAFGILGLLVALAGYMQTAYAGSNTPGIGKEMELDAIAACVIGGTSLRGGRGTVAGVLFGSLIMVSLLSGMRLLEVHDDNKYIIRGCVLLVAVWLDTRLARA